MSTPKPEFVPVEAADVVYVDTTGPVDEHGGGVPTHYRPAVITRVFDVGEKVDLLVRFENDTQQMRTASTQRTRRRLPADSGGGVMARLSEAQRHRLSSRLFGLPSQRAYAIHDLEHARLALQMSKKYATETN